MNESDHWFQEGSYAFKAGIDLPELNSHYPKSQMTFGEWSLLESGWLNMHKQYLERMGQIPLFD